MPTAKMSTYFLFIFINIYINNKNVTYLNLNIVNLYLLYYKFIIYYVEKIYILVYFFFQFYSFKYYFLNLNNYS